MFIEVVIFEGNRGPNLILCHLQTVRTPSLAVLVEGEAQWSLGVPQ